MQIPYAALHSFIALFCTSLIVSALPDDASCYWPDGSLDADGSPCNISDDESACCAIPDACFGSSGLSYSTGSGGIYQRNCTDSSFGDSSCPTVCTDVRNDSFAYLLQCTNIGSKSHSPRALRRDRLWLTPWRPESCQRRLVLRRNRARKLLRK